MAILDVLEEMILYKQIEDILPIIGYNSCHEKEKCTNLVHIKPTDMYISFAYPSMKFTFSYPDIKPGGSYYTFSFHLKRDIDCRFLLEGKERRDLPGDLSYGTKTILVKQISNFLEKMSLMCMNSHYP